MTTTSPSRKTLAVLAAAAAIAVQMALAPAGAAHAWAWDPHVKIQGQVSCGTFPNDKVTGLWLWTAEDGGRWIAYSVGVRPHV